MLDVLNTGQEVPYETWAIQAKQEALNRKKPSLRTCLGLGTTAQEGRKRLSKLSQKNSAIKDGRISATMGKKSQDAAVRKRNKKADQKNVTFISLITNPSNALLQSIAVTEAIEECELGQSEQLNFEHAVPAQPTEHQRANEEEKNDAGSQGGG